MTGKLDVVVLKVKEGELRLLVRLRVKSTGYLSRDPGLGSVPSIHRVAQ